MADVLSQNEIDALLSNMKSEGDAENGLSSEKEVVPFDFSLPNRISKIQLRTLRQIHENFSEAFSSFLMSKLQTIININVITVDQIYYSEYALSVSNPAALFLFQIGNTDIRGILELSPELAITLIDRLLGGTGENTKQSKAVTPIEQAVLDEIVKKVMDELSNAWAIIDKFNFEIDRFEPDIDFAQITSQSESVLLITFEIFIGEESFLMNLAFATYAFDTILSKLSSQNLSTIRPVKYLGTTAREIVSNQLRETKLNVSIEFGNTQLTFEQVQNLTVGDIIILDKKIGSESIAKVEGKPFFYAVPGISNNHKSVKVVKRIEEKEI
jgi:flagellar motor switch protein FliM